MSRKQRVYNIVGSDEALDNMALEDEIENLREGTRDQFESPFTLVPLKPSGGSNPTTTFTHGLGEIPWVVDIIASQFANGEAATTTTDVTLSSKTATEIVVENSSTTIDYYVQVRAM